MRKIKSVHEVKRGQRTNQIIVGVILIGLMVTSTAGFAFFSGGGGFGGGEKIEYGGIKFERNSNGFWQAEIGNTEIVTLYNPTETEDIAIDFSSNANDFVNQPLYFVFESAEGVAEVARNLGPYIPRYQQACLEGEACADEEMVVKDCSENVIVFRESENIKLYKQESCIFLEGPSADQARMADKLVFEIFNI